MHCFRLTSDSPIVCQPLVSEQTRCAGAGQRRRRSGRPKTAAALIMLIMAVQSKLIKGSKMSAEVRRCSSASGPERSRGDAWSFCAWEKYFCSLSG